MVIYSGNVHSTMSEKEKLILAIQQINNVVELMKDNEWKVYLYQHLNTVDVELNRQLGNLIHKENNV